MIHPFIDGLLFITFIIIIINTFVIIIINFVISITTFVILITNTIFNIIGDPVGEAQEEVCWEASPIQVFYFLFYIFVVVSRKIPCRIPRFLSFYQLWRLFHWCWLFYCCSSRNVSMTKISIEGARMGLGQDGLNVGWHNHNLRKIYCWSVFF